MAESVYKVIELIGTSTASWEKAAAAAVKLASQSLRDLRVAEVSELDMQIADGKVLAYRAKVKLSFKYTPGGSESDAAGKPANRARAKAAAEPAPAKRGARRAKRRPAAG
jgi:flavin-binding protein dodecin